MNFDSFIKNLGDIKERRLMYFLIAVILIINMTILVLSEGFSGGSYSLMHYQYAREAFTNPDNLLNGWASPLFTLVAAPFALLGFKSMQLMNIIFGILSGYFAYLVSRELKMKSPLFAMVICSFTPVFMVNFFGGTTEIMLAFTAILGTYLMLKERYVYASIVVSLLPLIRLDGLIVLPIYAIYLMRRKKFRYTFLLLSGLIFYSLVGFIAGKGLFWLFQGVQFWSKSVFGSGSFYQFTVRSPGYFGIPNEIFFVTGLVAGIWLYIRERLEFTREFVLVVLPFITYFLAHSFAWWLGIGQSQGISRYMAAIVPFMAVMGTRGLYLFAKMFYILFKREWVRIFALIIGFASIIHIPFVLQNYPVRLSSSDRALKMTADYINQNNLSQRQIYTTDPSFSFYVDNKSNVGQLNVLESVLQLRNIGVGSLLVYDVVFGEIKGINSNALLNSPELQLLGVFDTDIPTMHHGKPFKVLVFEKIQPDSSTVSKNKMIFDGQNKIFVTVAIFDFDSNLPGNDTELIARSNINPTAYFRVPPKKKEFLVTQFNIQPDSICHPVEIKGDLRLFTKTSDEKLRFFIEVISDEGSSRKFFEVGSPSRVNPDEWNRVTFTVMLPEVAKEGKEANIKCGFWNKRKGEFLIDDYSIAIRQR